VPLETGGEGKVGQWVQQEGTCRGKGKAAVTIIRGAKAIKPSTGRGCSVVGGPRGRGTGEVGLLRSEVWNEGR